MTPERALEIVSAVNDRCFFKMELVDKVGSLEGVSLAEMLEAVAIVKQMNKDAPAINGKRTIRMVPDDRLIAAAYVLDHYQPDCDAICIIPHIEGDLRAVAVLALEEAAA
jgi:hypothetical protein